jgi:RNA polymerase sigma-54 factor
MNTRASLELRQSQNLVMTQQLQQSIKMLQLSAIDLQEFILAEAQRNPLLTLGEGEGEGGSAESGDAEWSLSEHEDAATSTLDTSEESWWGGETDEGFTSRRYDVSSIADHSAGEIIEQRYGEEVTLQEHVRQQINTLIDAPHERLIAMHLADLLDDNGYLLESTLSLSQTLGTDEATLERIIRCLQACEPTGVFARNLRECLELQLEERGLLSPVLKDFLRHMHLFADGNTKKLSQLTGLDEQGLKEALALIRTLDPKPGSRFQNERIETIIPDIFIRRAPDRQWRVELNPDALPRVLINRQYHDSIHAQARNRDEKKFLNEQLSHANWLVKALDQRATNMLKIATEITRWQKDFLERGIHYLKPMKLSDIAALAQVHESTVSRISANKYMATPRGTFEMKYFFSTAVGGEDGEAQSSRVIMHEIKQLIAKESPDDILSDDTIARVLKERGMDVARRTVVKYRQLLDIPSSVDRRKQKKSMS